MIKVQTRLIAALLYLLPWSKALVFGSEMFNQYPILKLLIIPALPILYIEQFFPFSNLLIFLILYFGCVRNPRVENFIRFNALQTILLNIFLIIMNFGFQLTVNPFNNRLLIITISSFIWIVFLSITIFSIYKCLKGKEADLPMISNAVKMQL